MFTLDKLSKYKEYLITKKAEKSALDASARKLEVELTQAEKHLSLIEKSLVALQKLTELKKRETIDKIEEIISYGLQTIFEDQSYKFKIIDSIKRKQVSYDFRVFSDAFQSEEGCSIIDSRGGGLVAVTSFLLRVVLLCMMDKRAERFICLDEPFSALSSNYHQNLVTCVRQIAEKLDLQILIVSHQPSLDAMGDKVYKLYRKDNATYAKLIRDDNINFNEE